MRKVHYLLFALFLGLTVSITSCSDDDDDTPSTPAMEFPESQGTIGGLKALATGENGVGVAITEDIILEGRVVTNPSSTNFPKGLFIQVGEEAIKLSVDDSGATFLSLEVGQRVCLKARDLFIGVSYDVPVIGESSDDQYKVSTISEEKLQEVLIIDRETIEPVTPKVVTIEDIASPLAMVGTVVTINEVQFVDADKAKKYFSGEKSYATTNLIDKAGNKIAISTYKNAAFKDETVKGNNSGSVTAVLSIYSGKPQLILRSVDDLNFEADRFVEIMEPDPTTGEKVYFSEYSEGSSNNKYLEIFNNTGADIDLANYTIRTGSNGGDWSDAITLAGTLANQAIYVIAADQLDPTIITEADLQLAYPSPVHFNGDDAVGLFKKLEDNRWSLIDAIGVQGTQEFWTIGDVTEATKDHTLVRKMEVTTGNPDWTSASTEWIVKDINYWGSIGIREVGTDSNDDDDDEPTTGTDGINAGTYTGNAATDLFFSEYVEGTSNNKYLEIFNGTGADVDLSSFSIRLMSNEDTEWKDPIALEGTLPNGAVFVIANAQAALELSEGVNTTTAYNTATYFSGNDRVGLFKDGNLIDLIGVVADADGNGKTDDFAKNVTLVRNANVVSPVATWDSNEWTVNDENVVSNIGSHTFTPAN